MEGISHEVAPLAGTQGLGKLVAFYDDNGISIDGEVEGWHVVPNVDGHNSEAIQAAIERAKQHNNKPSLIICKTITGFGAPNKQGKESCHSDALGNEEVAAARKQPGWPHAPFHVPEEIYKGLDATARGAKWEQDLEARLVRYAEADALKRRLNGFAAQ
ncbi:Transketolase [Halomonas citrativorans]|uniref:Transketolase n=1 Tax=Halomonas citrativorans TaxID=2742612 RepID=A0A1R4HN91_9GAMM|nr:Transketolase [Halomonas citrativorans]